KAAYAAALGKYLEEPQEAGLMEAYDLGRRALTLDLRVVDLSVVHGQTLAEALGRASTPERRGQVNALAADFQHEALAAYEMTVRGYRENIALLQSVNATLEQRVQERTAALQEADSRKNEFLAMLAHELRNPLAPIRNALTILHLAGQDAARIGAAH